MQDTSTSNLPSLCSPTSFSRSREPLLIFLGGVRVSGTVTGLSVDTFSPMQWELSIVLPRGGCINWSWMIISWEAVCSSHRESRSNSTSVEDLKHQRYLCSMTMPRYFKHIKAWKQKPTQREKFASVDSQSLSSQLRSCVQFIHASLCHFWNKKCKQVRSWGWYQNNFAVCANTSYAGICNHILVFVGMKTTSNHCGSWKIRKNQFDTLHFLISIFRTAHPMTIFQLLQKVIANFHSCIWRAAQGKYFPQGDTKCPHVALYTEDFVANGFYWHPLDGQ